MRRHLAVAALAGPLLFVLACGGYSSSPTAPGGGVNTPPAGAIVIDIKGENGALSFSPNPATVAAGALVSWHNVDSQTHHVLLDDGRLDTGNIGAGQYSQAMTLPGAGPYHCTIHPSMVGSMVLKAAAR